MEIILKKIPKDLATIGKYITSIGGTYVIHKGNLARYQSKNQGINLEIEVDSLQDKNGFNCSYFISHKLTNISVRYHKVS